MIIICYFHSQSVKNCLLKVLIIEDDHRIATDLRRMLKEAGITESRIESTQEGALTSIIDFEPDLVIYDYCPNVSEHNFNLAKLMVSRHIAFIIITQNKDEKLFASLSAFKPIAYFTKPLDVNALRYTVSKLHEERTLAPVGTEIIKGHLYHYIFVRKESKFHKVDSSDILFLEGKGNYVTIHCIANKFVLRVSLKKCEDHLSSGSFIKIHRNYLVNKQHIDSFHYDSNVLNIGSRTLPIGRTYKHLLLEELPLFR